jgi:hypothetical protein
MKVITIALLCISASVQAVIIDSILLQRKGSLIAVWGDRHTHVSSDTDTKQLSALTTCLQTAAEQSKQPFHILVEEPIDAVKLFRSAYDRQESLFLHDAADRCKTITGVEVHNIEMREIALTSEIILRTPQVADSFIKGSSCDDTRVKELFSSLTPTNLFDNFQTLAAQCLKYINAQPAKHRATWQKAYDRAFAYFENLQRALAPFDQTTPLLDCRRKIDNEHVANETVHFIREAFARLFDIIVAHRITELSNSGFNVALCAGFIHTDAIMPLLTADRATHLSFRSPRDSRNIKTITLDDIDVFKPRPTYIQRILACLCSCSSEPDKQI